MAIVLFCIISCLVCVLVVTHLQFLKDTVMVLASTSLQYAKCIPAKLQSGHMTITSMDALLGVSIYQ